MSNKPGRNEPCPCGSGLKVKRCCTQRFAKLLVTRSPEELRDGVLLETDWNLPPSLARDLGVQPAGSRRFA